MHKPPMSYALQEIIACISAGQRPRDDRRDGERRAEKREPRRHAFNERMTAENRGFPNV
jgi:hypothetical protein